MQSEISYSILCVDDEQGILDSYLQVLAGQGDVLSTVLSDPNKIEANQDNITYHVFPAKSGEEALQIVKEELEKGNRFAAGFFDIRMPGGIDGYETIKYIRELDPEIYCAVVTAYTDRNPTQIRKLFSNGYMDHFLYFNKPFSALELEQTSLFLTTAWKNKQKEQVLINELRQAKNDWEDVFNTIDEAITIHDLNFNILRSNLKSQHFLQLGPNLIHEAKCYAVYHGQNDPPKNCPSCKTARTGIPSMSQFYEPFLKKYIEIKALPRFDTDDKLQGIIHVTKDITEEKKAEKALKESEERFREMAELLPVAIFEMDMNAKLTYANKCAFEYFGYDQQDFEQGLTGFDLISYEDRAKAQKNLSLIANTDIASLNEYEALRKNGTTFPIVIRTSMNIHNGKANGFRGVIMDVSEKKLLESKLFQSQKIESIGTLAGGIAHDFNNILTGILGYAELVLMKTDINDPRHQHVSEIINGGKRASNLVTQILTFSRQGEIEMNPIEILPVLKEALRLLRATIPSTIEIQQIVQPECQKAIIMADQTQLHQIIMNLCTNGFHAMRESGGTLKIEMSTAILDAENKKLTTSTLIPGDYIKISVTDTGKGMTGEELSRIFEPYFTTKKRGEGTGLGLAVTDGIIKKHGGDIFVYSTPGQGTTFEVYLPLITTNEKKDIKQSEQILPTGSENILFIDDESTIVHMSSTALGSVGYNVKGYTNSRDALSDFESDPKGFDLVITDMTMPKMDGKEVSRRIMEIRKDIPIIMCTGFSENITLEKAKQLGVERLLQKPVSLMEMAVNIRQLLDETN